MNSNQWNVLTKHGFSMTKNLTVAYGNDGLTVEKLDIAYGRRQAMKNCQTKATNKAMSDGSSNTMEPKEQKKTCGNCEYCVPCEWKCNSEISEFNFIVDKDDLWCGGKGYQEKNLAAAYNYDGTKITTFAGLPLEKAYDRLLKYQQLEQVARDMLGWFDRFLEEWGEDFELGLDAKNDILHDRKFYRNKLKELGVIDD